MDTDQLRTLMLILVILYSMLSLTVTWHCVVIVRLIRYILRSHNTDRVQNFLYILALTVVDAIVLIHLPLLCTEIVNGQWIFGLAWCRIFWIAESVNKILSTFILTVLCFDRYLAICWSSTGSPLRTPRTAGVLIIGCTVMAFILLSPFYVNAALEEIILEDNETIIIKCIIAWSDETEQSYTIFLFIFGYCAPILLMIFFYCSIICHLKKRGLALFDGSTQQTLARRRIRTRVVTRRSFALVLFYCVCWTPFWLFTFAVDTYSDSADINIVVFYFTHSLIYLNSSMNPMFYAVLNRELWSRTRSRRKSANNQINRNQQTVHHNQQTTTFTSVPPTIDEPETEF